MERVDRWSENLSEYLQGCEKKSFKWGVFDCAIFAGGACQAVYGTNPLKLLESGYKGKTSGLRLISELGDGSLWGACESVLKKYGMELAPRNFAQAGDIVGALNHENLEMLGVMEDLGTCTFASTGGLARLPLASVEKRWSLCPAK